MMKISMFPTDLNLPFAKTNQKDESLIVANDGSLGVDSVRHELKHWLPSSLFGSLVYCLNTGGRSRCYKLELRDWLTLSGLLS